jgi:hypothetical protein
MAMLGSLVVVLLALVTVFLFWPVVFATLVLLLVVLPPIVALGAGMQAILNHGQRRSDAAQLDAYHTPASRAAGFKRVSSSQFAA